MTGSNLEQREFSLPSDFEGDLNLIVLAFWRQHQALVDTWMPIAGDLEERHTGLFVYELPIIQTRNRLYQWFIDSGMRSGISDQRVRERTITLYVDKPPFLEAVGIRDDSNITSLVVDRAGRILWRAAGPATDSAESDLVDFLETSSLA